MRLKFIALVAAGLLVAACGSDDSKTTATTGGQAAPPVSGPAPGSQEDLNQTVGDRVFFAFDSSALSAQSRSTIEALAAWLKTNPTARLTIEGHTDERGTREYNLALGERRAKAVESYLVALGVQAARLKTISYGKERPAVLGSTEQAWAQNRRAVFDVN